MLPIKIETLPSPKDSESSLKTWSLVEKQLAAIAAQEQNNDELYAYQKIAYSSFAYAQYNANKRHWSTLWQYLLDRQILQIGVASAPPSKTKSDRLTKPPKNKVEPETKKPKKTLKPFTEKSFKPETKRKPKRKKRTILKFARLKRPLIRLQAFLYFANFLAYIAPLCPKTHVPLRDRAKGEKIKALLSYETMGGYASLKVYMPSTQSKYRMHPNVVKLLTEWSNPNRIRSEKKIESDKAKGAARRVITAEMLDSVLTDKWQDSGSISAKLNALLDEPIDFYRISKLLTNRHAAGEIHRLNREHRDLSYYSRIEATEFESQWLTLEMAYQLAKSRGYQGAKNSFRQWQRCDYASFGLGFRREVPKTENTLLRWRDIWTDI